MDESIHRSALRAAARVAWLGLLTGCGGSTELAPGMDANSVADSDQGTTTDGVDQDGSGGTGSVSEPAAVLSSNSGSTPAEPNSVGGCTTEDDAALVACCNSLLVPFVAPDEFLSDTSGPRQDPDIVACCDRVASLVTAPGIWADVLNCCSVAGMPAGVCTPWGPPVPPEFRLEQARA